MARMRPAHHELDQLLTPLNDGERRMADKLAELDDGWTVYVQPRLALDVPDFVAVHDRHGVCAIEVKDWSPGSYRQGNNGRIECLSGGCWTPTDEAPRYQAHRYRQTIFDHFFARPDDPDTPGQTVRAVLVLPRWQTERARKLFERPTVHDSEQSVQVFGGEMLQDDVERMVRATCPKPPEESVRRLHRQLSESDAVREQRAPAKLSQGARNVANNPSAAQRRRVRGPAGCGKSFGLAARAARLAADGSSVLVLTFNTTLSNYLRTLVGARCKEIQANPALVTCVPFHVFCARLVEDAKVAGYPSEGSGDREWFDEIVDRASSVCEQGFERRFDAVLVDEGQDFTLDWWNFLREHIVVEGGEMLLLADPTQDVYDKKAWTDEQQMLGAGFSGPWTELRGSYRMPLDLIPLANQFARTYLMGERLDAEVPDDHRDIAGASLATRRHWENLSSPAELGWAIGREVVRLLSEHPDLNPNDVAFLCEHHRAGLEAVQEIERAGYPVHHIFGTRADDKQRRKRRFWPDSPGVKGCTVHSFKGWETPALVMGIDRELGSRRLAYVAMTRVRVGLGGRPAYLSIINADLSIAGFESAFTKWSTPDVPMWAAPDASERLG